jgi:hypothetical protein
MSSRAGLRAGFSLASLASGVTTGSVGRGQPFEDEQCRADALAMVFFDGFFLWLLLVAMYVFASATRHGDLVSCFF